MYKKVTLELTKTQLRNAAKGKTITLTANQLKGNNDIYVHPANYDKITKAKRSGKGCRIQVTKPEIENDMNKLQGGSIWSSISSFLKKNWPLIKPILSAVADSAVQPLSTATGHPELVQLARMTLKDKTGVGIKPKFKKGSQEAKDHMKALRAKRKGSSFRLN